MKRFPVVDGYKHQPDYRYLFLDFDGVLHPEKLPFDLRYTKHVLPVVEALSLKVVISSAWREDWTMTELQGQLGVLGRYVVGMTPILDPKDVWGGHVGWKGSRQVEIQLWLEEHAAKDASWIAIDDIEGYFFEGCTKAFITDTNRGLDKRCAIRFLAFAIDAFEQQSHPCVGHDSNNKPKGRQKHESRI